MKTILALIDFSDVSARVLLHAENFARALGANVVLMHVTPPEPVVVDFAPLSSPPEELHAAEAQLQLMRDSLAAAGISASVASPRGVVVDTIFAWSQEPPNLIIMGSHGHGALHNLLTGSVTAGVLKKAKCPVLVVPSLLTEP